MLVKGINYDTGTRTTTGSVTRPQFDIASIERELSIIRNELHCNAIRITGFDLDRVVTASSIAQKLGLSVWFSPFLAYENQQKTYDYILRSAVAAEKLRSVFSNLHFVIGTELTVFTEGFVNGKTGGDRLANLFSPWSLLKNSIGLKRSYDRRLNHFLTYAVTEIRKIFGGSISYASGSWEKVDWKNFDIVGVDHYRGSYNKLIYQKQLDEFAKAGKPVAITEFGCCSYKGAEDKGAMGWSIVDWKQQPPALKGDFSRDESIQADQILELLELFEQAKINAAFVFTFITPNYHHREDPDYDIDMASYGIVKPLPNNTGYQGLPWEPKQAFSTLSEYYANH